MTVDLSMIDGMPRHFSQVPGFSVVEDKDPDHFLFTDAQLITQLRVDNDDADELELIRGKCEAAITFVESACSLSIFRRKVAISMAGFGCGEIIPYIGPIDSIDSFQYLSGSYALVDLPINGYRVRANRNAWGVAPGYGKSWPSVPCVQDAVVLTLNVGYAADVDNCVYSKVPPQIREAILLVLGDLYENREMQGVSTRIYSSLFENLTFKRLIAEFRPRRIR